MLCPKVAGSIYKRLLNHRPVLQNEVHLFIQEFEVSSCDVHAIRYHSSVLQSKRGESDLKTLQQALKNANEMDAMFLEEMKESVPLFRQLRANSE